jgi:hypothetical protein
MLANLMAFVAQDRAAIGVGPRVPDYSTGIAVDCDYKLPESAAIGKRCLRVPIEQLFFYSDNQVVSTPRSTRCWLERG